jgi:hypothetical protein
MATDLASRLMSKVGRLILPFYLPKLKRFLADLNRGREVQQQTLRKILNLGASTALGRDLGLASVRTSAEFRRQVPIAEYDRFAPYIERVARGETSALFPANEPLLTFVQTSATTGKAKIFPINRTWFQHYSHDYDLWGVKAYHDHPEMLGTRILNLAGPWSIGRTPGGHNIAIISAMIERYQSAIVRRTYALPGVLKQVSDVDARGYLTVRLAAPQQLGFLSTVTPQQILQIAEWVEQFGPQLVRDLHDGTLSDRFDVPAEVRRSLRGVIRTRHPELARRLGAILDRQGVLRPRDLWRPKLISCWLGGTVGHTSRRIPELFGEDVPLRDQGLLSSEGRHTIPLADNVTHGPLAIGSNFYEFVPAAEDATRSPTVFEAHELEVGAEYRIIMTTLGGLYRYDIGDIVKCVGYMGETPLIEFLQKAGGYCDLVGEKLSAFTVCQAVLAGEAAAGLKLDTFTVAPCTSARGRPRYAVVVEQPLVPDADSISRFLGAFDKALGSAVLIYGVTRRQRILEAPALVRIPAGEWRRYIAAEMQRLGASENQYKHKPLVSDQKFLTKLRVVDSWILQSDGNCLANNGPPPPADQRAA